MTTLDEIQKALESQTQATQAQTLAVNELLKQVKSGNAEIRVANSTQQSMAQHVQRIVDSNQLIIKRVEQMSEVLQVIIEREMPQIYARISGIEGQNKTAIDAAKKAGEAKAAADKAGSDLTTTDKLLAHSQKTTEMLTDTVTEVVNTLMEHTGSHKLPTMEELAAAEKAAEKKEKEHVIPRAISEGAKVPARLIIALGFMFLMLGIGLGVGLAVYQAVRHQELMNPPASPASRK